MAQCIYLCIAMAILLSNFPGLETSTITAKRELLNYLLRAKRSSICPLNTGDNGLDPRPRCEDPCAGKDCPKFPMANCVPNYCKECTHSFYFAGRKVDCN